MLYTYVITAIENICEDYMSVTDKDYEYLIEALKDIRLFGKANTGSGFSCAKKAELVLIEVGALPSSDAILIREGKLK